MKKKLTLLDKERLILMLGKVRDIRLAEEFGISREYVRQIRKFNGIKSVYGNKLQEVNKIIVPMLGKLSDKELAAKVSMPITFVSALRKTNNISAFRKSTRIDAIPKKVLELIGKKTDYDIEKTFGLHRSVIGYYRKLHGIKAVGNAPIKTHKYIKIKQKHIDLMGTMPDTLLAKKFNLNKLLIFKYRQKLGILKFTPQKYRIVPEVLTYIKNKCGTVSDAALAMETGTTVDKIFQIRVALQKPSWRETVEKRKKSMIQEIKPFLGTGSDRAVGVNFGINPQAVRKIRVQLGIPATFRKG